MAWTFSSLGLLPGISTAMAGLTGITADLGQISSFQTLMRNELAGVTTYNGARVTASGDVQTGLRSIQIYIGPVAMVTV